jgi:glycosyltransferase involved in cell wall biosynthesis
MRVAMIGDFPRSDHEVGGGVESVMLYLARELARAGQLDVHTVTLDRWGLGSRTLTMGGFTAHYVERSRLPSRAGFIRNVHTMRNRLGALRPDLVHAHIAGHYAEAAHASGLPWILTLHGIRYLEAGLRKGLLDRTYRRWLVAREERRSVRRAPYLISINPFVNQSFTDEVTGRVFPIENPVDDRFFELAQRNEPFTLLHVGRLTPRKDILTLLRAFRSLLQRQPGARLRLAGACDPGDPQRYCRSLHAYVQRHGMEEQVRFLGQTEQGRLLAEYARASVVVLSAVLETAPMAIAEALAAATAVVTTDAGGCRHLIDEGKTGRVVPRQDPDALARALALVLGPDGRALNLGVAGRATAEERFRARRVCEKTLEAYRAVLGASA